METADEALGCNSSGIISNAELVYPVVKGKRTKRRRTQFMPPSAAVVAEYSSSVSSAEEEEEEEDVANCLILLAHGRAFVDAGPKPEEQKDQAATAAAAGRAGAYMYECKTCGKCFPSFQALGGHRTGHKKPKLATPTAAAAAAAMAGERKIVLDDDVLQISMNSFSRPVASGGSQANTKPKVHECSICGSEFSSGQALGGHMRRHRPLGAAADGGQEAKMEKNFLSLDLNLPAPTDDGLLRQPSPAFELAGKRPLLFSASASALVVDCHY